MLISKDFPVFPAFPVVRRGLMIRMSKKLSRRGRTRVRASAHEMYPQKHRKSWKHRKRLYRQWDGFPVHL